MLKRFFALIIVLALFAVCFFGCGERREDRIDIVCTVFPIYDWVRNIIGEDNEDIALHLLVKNGTDPHSYTPSPSDVAKILSCDTLIYVGGESDLWVADVLEGVINEDMREIKLLELLGERAFLEENENCFEEDCHDHDHHHDHGHEGAYDEHIWLSLKNASFLCGEIAEALSDQFSICADIYLENAEKYINRVEELDRKFEGVVSSSLRKTLLFADRFPFGYMAEDYGIECFAAFSGCSADSEASFETVTGLAKKIDEMELSCVVILENSTTALADTVISNSKSDEVRIVVMDSLQSITETQIKNGVSYLSVMEKNLDAVKTALN